MTKFVIEIEDEKALKGIEYAKGEQTPEDYIAFVVTNAAQSWADSILETVQVTPEEKAALEAMRD